MGNDGGSIARRLDILALHGNLGEFGGRDGEIRAVFEEDKVEVATCELSFRPLVGPGELDPPIVSDWQGKLYLKEKVLELILGRKSGIEGLLTAQERGDDERFHHIQSIKDLVEVKVQWRRDEASGRYHLECPVTKELNARLTFAYLRPCGCVLAYKFLRKIGPGNSSRKRTRDGEELEESLECPNCTTKFKWAIDVVILNPLNKPQFEAFNRDSYRLVQDTLKLHHSKAPIKSKNKRKKLKKVSESKEKDHPSENLVSATLAR